MNPMTPRRPPRHSDGGCLLVVLMLASLVPLSVIHGATFMKLWQWFVAEPFDLPAIGLPHAIGLTAIASALTVTSRAEDDDPDPWAALVKVWMFRLVVSGLLLLEGWVLSGWVA